MTLRPLLSALALSLLAAPALTTLPASAETVETARIGPQVGDAAPDFTGAELVLAPGVAPAAGEAGTVLVFFRSADWCPFCKAQLLDLEAVAAPLAEAGWRLEAISYDAPAVLSAFAEENSLNFGLRSDEGSAVIRAYGLLNTEVREASRSYGIPHPAVVFVGADGTVAAVLREEGYRTRPGNDEILATATGLAAGD